MEKFSESDYKTIRSKLRLMNLSEVGRETGIHREILSRFCRGETSKLSISNTEKVCKLMDDVYCTGWLKGFISAEEVSFHTGYTVKNILENIDKLGIPYHKVDNLMIFSEKEVFGWLYSKDKPDETIS